MRLRRLDLLRYGHFTGRSIDFPAAPRDLHLVFGPNEAGKSTALSAIEDLLFGIPMQSALNFLHDYRDMRIGGVLESGADALDFRRRKGNRDTLLDADELPLPGADAALQPFLAGADRAFFERMFSLDHQRLDRGGREILDARDDIGRTLFAASAGIADLRERLRALEEEADGLWGARRASRRLYTQAADRLDQADRELREQIVTAAQWEDRRDAMAAAEKAHEDLETEYIRLQAEGRRLSRIRRVHRDVRRKRELTRDLETIGRVVRIPEDAPAQLGDAENRVLEASIRMETLGARIGRLREEIAGLKADTAVLLRADEIGLLHERRIEVRRARADLPKRQAELGIAEARMHALAKELDWRHEKLDALAEALPTRAKLHLARSLLAERGAAASSLDGAREALHEAAMRRDRIQARFESIPVPPDRSGLASGVAAVGSRGDLAGSLRAASEERDHLRREVERLHKGMSPALEQPDAAVGVKVPTRPEVQRLRDLTLDWEQRDRDLRRQLQGAEEELDRLRHTLERTSQQEGDLSREDLAQARAYRDALWGLLERRRLRGEPLSDQEAARFSDVLEDLPGQFRNAVRKADAVADLRFERAEVVGRLTQMTDAVKAQQHVVGALGRRREVLNEERADLRKRWHALWAPAKVEPLAPDAMLAWLDSYEVLLQRLDSRDAADARYVALLGEERQAREGLLSELEAIGLAGELAEQPLPVLWQRSVEWLRALEGAEADRDRVGTELREANEEVERRRRDLERADAAWADWKHRWTHAVADLGLSIQADPPEIARQLETIVELQTLAAQVQSLRRDRIDKIQVDIDAFEKLARAFVRDIAPDLAENAPEEAVVVIERRLDEAREIRKRQLDRERQIQELEGERTAAEEQLQQARGVLAQLMDLAEVHSVADLRDAIERDAAARQLRAELDRTMRTLENEGDGLSPDALERECAGVDVDQVAAREQALDQELRQLRIRLEAAVETRAATREAFAEIGGDDAAALTAATRQEALAELRWVSERYVRTRTAAELLKWAIDRYRREKQAPMLRRAGEIFTKLTGGAFAALRVDYDERDQPQLIGVRADGESVAVPGLSTGTADQLYLALRIASIEDYLDHSPGLPFVADDLFINFDDQRAAAGLEVLAELSARTQVLFFTHHRHLVDIARERIGAGLHVELLADA